MDLAHSLPTWHTTLSATTCRTPFRTLQPSTCASKVSLCFRAEATDSVAPLVSTNSQMTQRAHLMDWFTASAPFTWSLVPTRATFPADSVWNQAPPAATLTQSDRAKPSTYLSCQCRGFVSAEVPACISLQDEVVECASTEWMRHHSIWRELLVGLHQGISHCTPLLHLVQYLMRILVSLNEGHGAFKGES